MRRYELNDTQWEKIKDLFPKKTSKRGRFHRPHRLILNGIFWILFSGASWRDLPERFGPWKTVYDRFRRWEKDGTFDKVLSNLQMQTDAKGLLDWSLFSIDSTSVRAGKAAAGASKKKKKANRQTMR